jgi:hypothetical protein
MGPTVNINFILAASQKPSLPSRRTLLSHTSVDRQLNYSGGSSASDILWFYVSLGAKSRADSHSFSLKEVINSVRICIPKSHYRNNKCTYYCEPMCRFTRLKFPFEPRFSDSQSHCLFYQTLKPK